MTLRERRSHAHFTADVRAPGITIAEGIRITEIPQEFFESTAAMLSEYTVGFLRIEDGPNGQEAVLLGSGTLVKVGDVHAILTAHHVVEVLPKTGRLGLILTPQLQRYTVDTQGLDYRRIARGTNNAEGPDLGAVILTPSIVTSISAKKRFYDLTARQGEMLSGPIDIERGVWFVQGFPNEKTVVEPGRGGYSQIKGFCNFGGAGRPNERPSVREGHDYIRFPISGASPQMPGSYKGMSGGGLWQVPVTGDSTSNIRSKVPLLVGVVFYQNIESEGPCDLLCHGPESVYRVAYNAISRTEP